MSAAKSGNDGAGCSAAPAFRHSASKDARERAYGSMRATSQKKIGPCLRLWARGSPAFFSSVSLEIEGDGAPTRRMARIAPGGVSGLLRTMRCTLSVHPAPCGAPTRHLGLYAFDRGRTGPAPSGRRGCPSTARGRRLRKSFARRCRSRSPPTRRLMNAPLVEWIGIGAA